MKIREKYPELEGYILSKPYVTYDFKEEWGWDRYKVGGKMFAAFCGDNGENPLITIKCTPATNLVLRNQYSPDIKEGYYMNKTHWSSIEVSGSVPFKIIKSMIDEGYSLIYNSLTKKVKAELEDKL